MKKYLNIKEAAKIIGLKEHVIRYWDSIDPKTNMLRIEGISTKSKGGTRYFNRDNLNKLQNLKDLIYENGNFNPSLKLAEKIISKKNVSKEAISNKSFDLKTDQNIKQILQKMKNLLQ
tara:strand:+ start:3267 stop:3620 length:354 start_codon:yes stop_codon:yes gene_type:complete